MVGPKKYKIIRYESRKAYFDSMSRIIFEINILKKIIFSVDKNYKFRSGIKGLFMKIIQIILLEKYEYEYTNEGLAKKIDIIISGTYDSALYL